MRGFLLTALLLASCGRVGQQAERTEDISGISAARESMSVQEDDASRELRKKQSLQSVDVFYGSKGQDRSCREWRLIISRTDGERLALVRMLRPEKKQGDFAKEEHGVVSARSKTLGGIDGVRLSVPRDVEILIRGILLDCRNNVIEGFSLGESQSLPYKQVGKFHFILSERKK